MVSPPVILVQLIHFEGPFKGQIQEFTDAEISIGRHPDCHLKFPAEANSISRKHADIVRDGNRFKLVDHSANGTAVNGKMIKEMYLKDGDVLTFSPNGPKVSFISKISNAPIQTDSGDTSAPPPQQTPETSTPSPAPPPPQAPQVSTPPPQLHAEVQTPAVQSKPAPRISPAKVKAPLIIQFGPTLRSYKELPVSVGKHPNCDFCIDHPGILDQHAQIFFYQDQYWLKDLTGQKLIMVNGQTFENEISIQPNDSLTLSPQGPAFQFLGGGRLAEVEQPPQATPPHSPAENVKEELQQESLADDISRKAKSIFQKYLKR